MSDTKDMEKLAAEIPAILTESSAQLRKLAHENTQLVEERDAALYELRLNKVARRLEERNLESDLSFTQKLAYLQSIDPSKMDAFEQAIELSTGGFKLGSIQREETVTKESSETLPGELGSRDNHETLDRFILSGSALGG